MKTPSCLTPFWYLGNDTDLVDKPFEFVNYRRSKVLHELLIDLHLSKEDGLGPKAIKKLLTKIESKLS